MITAEVEPYLAMWEALARLLREREADARDRAIADAIDGATQAEDGLPRARARWRR